MDTSLCRGCHHERKSLAFCITYGTALSSIFVLNLYVLVPHRIRELPRDDVRHVRWRMVAVAVTLIAAMATYPLLFLSEMEFKSSFEIGFEGLSVWHVLGWTRWSMSPLLHAVLLYLGPIVASILDTKRDYFSYNELTILLRNLVMAPISEEIIFRSCIVTPLVANSTIALSLPVLCWTAPLFFGVAHFHHAILKLRASSKSSVRLILLGTSFQFLYTTLFGAYATYAYCKTASLPAVCLLHSFCNFMGLPDLSFLTRQEKKKKIIISIAYAIGILGFGMEFFIHSRYRLLRLFGADEPLLFTLL